MKPVLLSLICRYLDIFLQYIHLRFRGVYTVRLSNRNNQSDAPFWNFEKLNVQYSRATSVGRLQVASSVVYFCDLKRSHYFAEFKHEQCNTLLRTLIAKNSSENAKFRAHGGRHATLYRMWTFNVTCRFEFWNVQLL